MPRRKSLCTRMKKPKSCKKFKGCKYASGPKRKFCRTKKNRSRRSIRGT